MKTILFVAAILATCSVNAQSYSPIDTASKLHFVIKNFAINTGGDISGMSGKIKFDAKKPAAASFDVTAKVSTIDTDNEKRDKHLMSDDFFEAEKYPLIRIISTKIEKGKDMKNFIFKGQITIKNVTKMVEFPFTAERKNGGALFTGEFEIDRTDFGIGKKSATMSDKVKVSLSVFAKAS